MTIVPGLGLVLDMTGINRDLPRFLLRSLVDILVGHVLRPTELTQNLGNPLGQCRLSVIDMSDSTDVDVRFVAIEVAGEAS